ncbi:hypothetical protein G6F35_010716 [Rhizopus arrhizus]|nr:hypothetical protein G6F35_010716 [Rhizopus arrhizus]
MPILPARGVLLRGVYARRPSTAALNRRHAEGCIPARVGPHTAAAFFHYNAVPARALARQAGVAQLVEQRTENPRVGGSIPSSATIFRDLQKCRSFFVFDFLPCNVPAWGRQRRIDETFTRGTRRRTYAPDSCLEPVDAPAPRPARVPAAGRRPGARRRAGARGRYPGHRSLCRPMARDRAPAGLVPEAMPSPMPAATAKASAWLPKAWRARYPATPANCRCASCRTG